jgi:hypothetical protein
MPKDIEDLDPEKKQKCSVAALDSQLTESASRVLVFRESRQF